MFCPRYPLILVVVGSLLANASPSFSQATPCVQGSCALDAVPASRLSGLLRLQQRLVMRHGLMAPPFGPKGAPEKMRRGADVLLRVKGGTLALAHRKVLASWGVVVKGAGIAGVYRAWIPWRALEKVAEAAFVTRVETAWSPTTTLPLRATLEETGAGAAHQTLRMPWTGKGRVIADVDSGIDVLHPAFFFADGGSFDWLDVNKSGAFEPGVDAIDVDADGQADTREIAEILEGAAIVNYQTSQVEGIGDGFQVERDWIFADLNQDGRRNVGKEDGFLESDPGFGEPLFVVADDNRNGTLDPGERVVMLKTSKIRRYVTEGVVYERGTNLIDGAMHRDQSFHGSGVAGIGVGGQVGYHERVGMAPDAEWIAYGFGVRNPQEIDTDVAFFLEDLATQDGVDVLLQEWSDPLLRPLDGSTNLEAMLDNLADRGILHVNPLGNLNEARKHIERTLEPGGSQVFDVEVGEGFALPNGEMAAYQSLFATWQWQGDVAPVFTIQAPDGEMLEVDLTSRESFDQPFGSTWVSMEKDRTGRGTTLISLVLYDNSGQGQPLPAGTWSVSLRGAQGAPVDVIGRVGDYYSGWGVGIHWREETRDRRTLCYPSTGDTSLGVAAYAGVVADQDAMPGMLRGFSGRGPRLDGEIVVSLAAPDDPLSVLGWRPGFPARAHGWYGRFGGTSGAAPHVAGVAALLKEQDPTRNPQDVYALLVSAARQDDLEPFSPMMFPDIHWGSGKLDAYQALYGVPRPQNDPPVAVLEVRQTPEGWVLDASGSRDEGMMEARFDLDGDGAFDTEWGALTHELNMRGETREVSVMVRDAFDAFDVATQMLVVTMDEAPADMGVMEPRADMGMDVGTVDPEPGCGSCRQVPGRAGGWSPLMLLGLFAWRRRGRRHG